jgi:hypothetical protein
MAVVKDAAWWRDYRAAKKAARTTSDTSAKHEIGTNSVGSGPAQKSSLVISAQQHPFLAAPDDDCQNAAGLWSCDHEYVLHLDPEGNGVGCRVGGCPCDGWVQW